MDKFQEWMKEVEIILNEDYDLSPEEVKKHLLKGERRESFYNGVDAAEACSGAVCAV